MLIRLKLIICPLKAKDAPIGYTRGVGRPKKAKLALQFQPDYFLDIINDSIVMMKMKIGMKVTTKIPFVQRQIQEIMMCLKILMTQMWMLMTL